MNCPRCSSKTTVIMALASDQDLPPRQPNLFVQYRCQQGHYFITLKVLDRATYPENYLTSDAQNPDVSASLN